MKTEGIYSIRSSSRRETAGPKGRHCRVTNPCEKADAIRGRRSSRLPVRIRCYLHSQTRGDNPRGGMVLSCRWDGHIPRPSGKTPISFAGLVLFSYYEDHCGFVRKTGGSFLWFRAIHRPLANANDSSTHTSTAHWRASTFNLHLTIKMTVWSS